MRRALLAAALAAAALLAAADPRALFSEIGRDLAELSRITGLKLHHQVPYDTITRQKVNEYLKQKVKEEVKPEELRAEELALKKFGFVPQDFDLVKSTVDLLTEQAAAFYDFRKKRLFVADWGSSAMQQVALVHELAHALADQNFHLERFIKAAGKSDDGSLARMAVMEGQASWLMSEVMARRMGQSLASTPGLEEQVERMAGSAGSEYPEFEKSPLYIRETLMFPYTKGMLFQHAVYRKMGQAAFSEVFRRAPQSTQQILHPEKYFERLAPAAPMAPAVPKDFSTLAEGTVGELDHSILLRQYTGKETADEVAPRWRGGAYRIAERKTDRRAVLAYASQWDSPETARRFFALYQRVLKQKWKQMSVRRQSPEALEGSGDDGNFVLRVEGAVVSSLEGLP